MARYLVERNIPGAGKLSSEQLQEISAHSCNVIAQMERDGLHVRWESSYVTPDKIFCVYHAPDENAVREHASRGGFPATNVFPIGGTIGPETAQIVKL
jgi:hypothetical protein